VSLLSVQRLWDQYPLRTFFSTDCGVFMSSTFETSMFRSLGFVTHHFTRRGSQIFLCLHAPPFIPASFEDKKTLAFSLLRCCVLFVLMESGPELIGPAFGTSPPPFWSAGHTVPLHPDWTLSGFVPGRDVFSPTGSCVAFKFCPI